MQEVAELYKCHAPSLYRQCYRIVRNPDEARDLVQETFARYLSSKHVGRETSAFALLHRIAINASIDRLRRRTRASEDERWAEAQAADLGAERRSIGVLRDLAFLTKGLSEEELTVAVMHHVDGCTQDGIAESLARSRRTIGKILRRFEVHVQKRAARAVGCAA